MKKALLPKLFSSKRPSYENTADSHTVVEPFHPLRKPENGDTLPQMFFMTGEPEDGPGMWVRTEDLGHMGQPEDYLSPEERIKWAQAAYPGTEQPDDELEP